MDTSDFFSKAGKKINNFEVSKFKGKILSAETLKIKAIIPDASVGDEIILTPPNSSGKFIKAEVTGFNGEEVWLSPFDDITGISSAWTASISGKRSLRVSESMIGHVYDALGRPIDGSPEVTGEIVPINASPPHPLKRKKIDKQLVTGIRVIDGLLSLGIGQRIGLFAGSGVGKSTLIGMLAENSSAEINVICMVGERGREVSEFLENSLGKEGLKRSVVIVSTSDNPALMRAYAPLTATAVAEYFRKRGKDVLLFVDSLTRYARALREIGLAMGETPARRGYPPGVFAKLPILLERAGNSDKGSITGIYTVLVEGGDMDEPVADEVRGILDGHIILSRFLAAAGHYPAVSVNESISRVMPAIVSESHLKTARKLASLIDAFIKKSDFITAGAYEKGSDPYVDYVIEHKNEINAFLQQGKEFSKLEYTLSSLQELVENI